MKVFVIGGSCVPNGHQDFTAQVATLEDSMVRIGRGLIQAGHDLLVCSPFPGAADVDAVRGAAEVFAERGGPVVEFHTPNLPDAKEKLSEFTRFLPVERVRPFFHPVSADEQGEPQLTYTWLLSQMSALDRCQVVLAVGGKLNGSSSLLLPVAENQRKLVLPLTFLGGAAAQSFERRRYELMDRLGDGILTLQDPRRVDEAGHERTRRRSDSKVSIPDHSSCILRMLEKIEGRRRRGVQIGPISASAKLTGSERLSCAGRAAQFRR